MNRNHISILKSNFHNSNSNLHIAFNPFLFEKAMNGYESMGRKKWATDMRQVNRFKTRLR